MYSRADIDVQAAAMIEHGLIVFGCLQTAPENEHQPQVKTRGYMVVRYDSDGREKQRHTHSEYCSVISSGIKKGVLLERRHNGCLRRVPPACKQCVLRSVDHL